MNTNVVTPLDWFFLLSLVFIAVISLYQACINLFYGKISRFSIDAILVFLIIKFGTEKARTRAQTFTKNVDRIMLFGLYALFSFIGAIYGIIVWFQEIAK